MYTYFAKLYDWHGSLEFAQRSFLALQRIFQQLEVKPARLLEVGCGTGTLAINLIKAGWSVYGFDLSQQMLNELSAKMDSEKIYFPVWCQDMRRFYLDAQFDVVTSFYDVLNHVESEDELHQTLACITEALKPGGYFIFDVNTFEAYRQLWNDVTDFLDLERGAVVIQCHFNEETCSGGALVTTFLKKGTLYEKHFEEVSQRYFSDEVIMTQLQKTGFEVLWIEPFTPFETNIEEPIKSLWVVRKTGS